MVGTWTTSHVLKWILTAICLLILGGLVCSMRRSVIWHSSNLRYEVGLARGGIGFGWRPAGWRLKDERYPPGPGLSWPPTMDRRHCGGGSTGEGTGIGSG